MTGRDWKGFVFAVVGASVVIVAASAPLPDPLLYASAIVGTVAMARGGWIVTTGGR